MPVEKVSAGLAGAFFYSTNFITPAAPGNDAIASVTRQSLYHMKV